MRSVAIAVRNLPGYTGASAIILKQIEALTSLQFKVDILSFHQNKSLVKQVGGNCVSLKKIYANNRENFIKRCDAYTKKSEYDFVIGHGDIIVQDIVFLHNLIKRAHEEINGLKQLEKSDIGAIHTELLTKQEFKLLIANSELMKQDLINRYNIPSNKIKVIYPGYDPNRFQPISSSEKEKIRNVFGFSKNDFIYGFITSGDFQKRGIDIFVEAIQLLPPNIINNSKFLIVGKTKNISQYLFSIKNKDIRARIVYTQPIPKVENLFKMLDAFVHCARFEEFGLVVQEAMACGIPVITSKKVGAHEIFMDNPFLIEDPEKNDLAKKMVGIYENTNIRATVSEKGILMAKENTWDKNIYETIKMMNTCGLNA